MATTIVNFFESQEEFEDLLEEAESSAELRNNEWQHEFVLSLRDRYLRHAMQTFMSDKQARILRQIAEGE